MAKYVNKDKQIKNLIDDLLSLLDLKEKNELIGLLQGIIYQKESLGNV